VIDQIVPTRVINGSWQDASARFRFIMERATRRGMTSDGDPPIPAPMLVDPVRGRDCAAIIAVCSFFNTRTP